MKKIFEKFINILVILALFCSILEPFVNISIVANAQASTKETKSYVYLSDLWNDKDVLLTKTSSWNDARALKVNQNEPGNLISLKINGEQTYFINGIFAHATSTLIFDLQKYKEQGFDMFSAYIGVDSSNGNGVSFTISGSNDNSAYTTLKTINTLKGTNEAEKVDLQIGEYRYLKLYANANGDNSSDHSVYANAMIYNSKTYKPSNKSSVDWIKPLSEYDADLKKHTEEEIITNDKLELSLRFLIHPKKQRIVESAITEAIIKEFKKDNITLL